jgi:hypothetical protein
MHIAIVFDQGDCGNTNLCQLIKADTKAICPVAMAFCIVFHIEQGKPLFVDFFLITLLVHFPENGLFGDFIFVMVGQHRSQGR